MAIEPENDLRPDEARRLAEARLSRGFDDAKAAAAFFGWNYTTYSQHERGERGLRKDVAEKYAKAFRVSAGWLLTGEVPQPRSRAIVSVMGMIGAGAEIDADVEQPPPEGYYEIETGFSLPTGSIAFEVVGESMHPRYDPGDIIICPRSGTAFQNIPNKAEAAVLTIDGKRYLKKMFRTDREGVYDLVSHNAEIMRSVALKWAAEILMIIPASKWTRVSEGERQRLYREAAKMKKG